MPGNRRQSPAVASNPIPPSPTTKGTAKYTNKDGSKFITVPKANSPVEPSYPSPTGAASGANSHETDSAMAPGSPNESSQPVNRKKQKRRAKAAAKAAAEEALHQHSNGLPSPAASHEQQTTELEADDSEDESRDYQSNVAHENGYADQASKKKSKKKKKKSGQAPGQDDPPVHAAQIPAPQPPRIAEHRGPGISKEKIWNTSSQEERERIKEFWLGLGEDERKSLVKVEKDAVLKKMKEQQKHTCSCTVCGRKRTAIEEELEGLYDAYYQELEQFANHPNQGDPPMMGTHRPFSSLSVAPSRGSTNSHWQNHRPSRGRIVEQLADEEEEEDDDDGEDGYSEDDLEEDEYSDEPSEDSPRNDYATEFFNFGNSLTVQGGILTVADDLLKNDGKKFIEMMEQLAERRMAREEDAKEQFERQYNHANGDRYGHNHLPPDDEEYDEEEDEYEEEEEDDYDSQEEEDTMTEEQRMEEGRRMFQIFAARMFEQRVLTAYREKVAKERQQQLLEEIAQESKLESQKAAKKAKEAQKRKDKAAKKKEQAAEEKARRDAEKAAEEEARLAAEARKAEEARMKAEEKRKKKEAQKKAEEEERLRKEAERQRRLNEQREKQAETERKAKEAKERERRAKEEARIKEKEARERKEREARERKEQQERDKREKDAKARAERADREAREKKKQEERAAQKAAALGSGAPITLAKRPAPHSSVPAAIPALPQQASTAFASPQIAVATPALPKAPTPIRLRQGSQQEHGPTPTSSQGVPPPGPGSSQAHSPHPITPIHASPGPGPIGPPSKAGSVSAASGPQQPSQAASPLNAAAKAFPAQPAPYPMQSMGLPFPPGIPPPPPGLGNRLPMDVGFPPMGQGFRPGPPGLLSMPPGLNGPMGGGRGLPFPGSGPPPPGFGFPPMDMPMQGVGHPFGPVLPKEPAAPGHSRQPSSGFEPSTPASAHPISRPAPIGRPSSVVHGQGQGQRLPSGSGPSGGTLNADMEDRHLGSSALLDDSDQTFQDIPHPTPRRATAAPGPQSGPRPIPGPGSAYPFAIDPMFGSSNSPWATNTFGPSPPPPPGLGPNLMSTSWGMTSPSTLSLFGGQPKHRPSEPHAVTVRKLLCRACEVLAREHANSNSTDGSTVEGATGFFPLEAIKARVDQMMPNHPVPEKELLDLCDTEGNDGNGGGNFEVRQDASGSRSICFIPSSGVSGTQQFMQRAVGAHGDIGSPIIGGPSPLTSTSTSGPGLLSSSIR